MRLEPSIWIVGSDQTTPVERPRHKPADPLGFPPRHEDLQGIAGGERRSASPARRRAPPGVSRSLRSGPGAGPRSSASSRRTTVARHLARRPEVAVRALGPGNAGRAGGFLSRMRWRRAARRAQVHRRTTASVVMLFSHMPLRIEGCPIEVKFGTDWRERSIADATQPRRPISSSRARLGGVQDPGHDDRDVVDTALVVGEVHQGPAEVLRVLVGAATSSSISSSASIVVRPSEQKR